MKRDIGSQYPHSQNFRLDSISDQAMLREFCSQAEQELGIAFPIEYVRRANALAFVDNQDRLFGGAMLISDPPFRSLDSIPGDVVDEAVSHCESLSTLAEINGVWIADGGRSPLTSLVFWSLLLRLIVGCGRKKFLFTFDNSNDRMTSLLRWIRPYVIYSGPTRKLAGMKKPSSETIAMIDDESLSTVLEMLESRGVGVGEAGAAALVAGLKNP